MNCNPPQTLEWVAINLNQILTSRQTTFKTNKNNKKKVGMNALANRFWVLNGKIPLAWFNMSFETFKVKCKNEFLL